MGSEHAAAPAPPQPVAPAMGWLWQPGNRTSPTAAATVANLKQDRIKAKKSLGQNFLTDDSILIDIVRAAGVQPGDLVLEVGPGTGNLTKHLLEAGARVTAVEKDDTLCARLKLEYAQDKHLLLVNTDVLTCDIETMLRAMITSNTRPPPGGSAALSQLSGQDSSIQLARLADVPANTVDDGSGNSAVAGDARTVPTVKVPLKQQRAKSIQAAGAVLAAKPPGGGGRGGAGSRKVKVVANLPYNITTDFLKRMLPLGDLVSELHIMIQDEVADRLVDRTPGRRDYRAMNLRVQYFSDPTYQFQIDRSKYDPAPSVHGALVTFALLPPPKRQQVISERGFLGFVEKAFSERRKMMRNSLTPLHASDQVAAALSSCGLRSDARAQDLTLPDFVRFHTALVKPVLQAAAAAAAAGGGDASSSEAGSILPSSSSDSSVDLEDEEDDSVPVVPAGKAWMHSA
ncbi:MAG: hypothetical protein WDW36_010038 [Sanguina aurantia]